jgi:hypothetical protein
VNRQPEPPPHRELAVDRRQVTLDRFRADAALGTDLPVGQASRDMLGDLLFTASQGFQDLPVIAFERFHDRPPWARLPTWVSEVLGLF